MEWILKYFSPPSTPSSLPPPPSPEFKRPWRAMDWSVSNQKTLLGTLKNFQPGNSEVDTLRILLHGPVGAGKSSFINSVDTCFKGRNTTRALADSISGKSFTLKCNTYKLKKDTTGSLYPFIFTDIRGIEGAGIQIDDIIKILHGHIQNDYTFNPVEPISEENPKYIKSPSLKDKIHCLVSVLPANTLSLTEDDVIKKMREVRIIANRLGIPQAIILTKVDELCPLVTEKLEKIYTSKKVKEKVEECSLRLGVPVNCIFPVKNYHEERTTDTTLDILILDALQNIVNFANDYVEDQVDNK